MNKLLSTIVAMTMTTSLMAASINVNVNPVINFKPTITVSPTITNTNTVSTIVKVNNGGRYADDVTKVKNVDIRPLLIEIKKLSDKMTILEEKDEKLEKLVEILGKKDAKPIIDAKRTKMDAEYKKMAAKQISLVELIKKLEKSGNSFKAKDGKIGKTKVVPLSKKNKKAKGIVLFKTNAERKEWKALEKINPRLLNLIIKTAQFTKKNFNKPLILTELHRTNAEQASLYGANYKKKSWHQFWSAVDFRSRIFTNGEILSIIEFIKKEFKGEGKNLKVLYHRISGSVYHFHVTLKSSKYRVK